MVHERAAMIQCACRECCYVTDVITSSTPDHIALVAVCDGNGATACMRVSDETARKDTNVQDVTAVAATAAAVDVPHSSKQLFN